MKKHSISADDIEKIGCRIDSRGHKIVCEPREAKTRPDTDYMMRFSLPYIMAVTALLGRVSPWEIDMKYANDPKVRALMDKVECITDDSKANPGHFPGFVAITTKDGRVFEHSEPFEPGAEQNPIGIENVIEKYKNNVRTSLSGGQADSAAEKIQNFERLRNMKELIDQLRIDSPAVCGLQQTLRRE